MKCPRYWNVSWCFFHASMYLVQAAWNKIRPINQHEQTSMNMNQNMFSVSHNICAIILKSMPYPFYHLWSEAHIMMLPAFFKWAEDLRDYPYLLLCLRTWGCVEMSIWEVSGWSELFRWLNGVSGSRYFVLCQELEHLNVTWVSERDVPETVDMWRHRKLNSAHLWWWRQDKWRWRVTARRRGLCYFVQHNQVKVICECISTLKRHPCWSWMNKPLAV